MLKSAGAHNPPSTNISPFMRELIHEYIATLARENASPHTIRNYESDLDQFVAYFTLPDAPPPALTDIDALAMREWLGALYRQGLTAVTVRRKLAAVRSWFKFLEREGRVDKNPARLVRSAKLPKTLPPVMTPEQTNNLLDAAAEGKFEGPNPVRDLAILEMLYGCGVRVSELVGMNLDDIDFSDRWVRIRGKGRKERQVPVGAKAAAALERCIADRHPALSGDHAVFLNSRGGRLTDRSVRNIVKLYATLLAGDSSLHPHSFRHAYATHLLADGADLRSIQELLGHARLSTTQRYTQVALSDLMTAYDKAHPKA
jgi:integrase/recombinase XerC